MYGMEADCYVILVQELRQELMRHAFTRNAQVKQLLHLCTPEKLITFYIRSALILLGRHAEWMITTIITLV